MSDAAEVLALLRAALGDRVDTTEAARHDARADKSGHAASGSPLAVVHAASVADVQATLRIATATGTPVVTRGAGTGLAGGANAGAGEIALSMRGMDRIIEVRPDDLLAVHPFVRAVVELLVYVSATLAWWSMGLTWVGLVFAVVAVTAGVLAGRRRLA